MFNMLIFHGVEFGSLVLDCLELSALDCISIIFTTPGWELPFLCDLLFELDGVRGWMWMFLAVLFIFEVASME